MLYRIGYYWEEGSDTIELEHDDLFTQTDFGQMVIDAAVAVAPQVIEERAARNWHKLSFDDLYRLVADHLCETRGFRKVQYAAIVDAYSLDDLRHPEDVNRWEERRDCNPFSADLAKALREAFPLAESVEV